MSGLKSWMRCLSFVVVVFLLSGCVHSSIFTDSLLVDQSEITTINKLGIRFQPGVPKGLDPNGKYGMAKELTDAGYFSGQFGSSYVEGAADSFRHCGIDVVNGRSNMPAIGNNEADNFSHFLDIVPTSFTYSSSGLGTSTMMKAEMRLYDLKRKKIVWTATISTSITSGRVLHNGRDAGSVNAELALLSLDEKGFITLNDENKAQIFDKHKAYFEFVKDKAYLEYVDSKRTAQ